MLGMSFEMNYVERKKQMISWKDILGMAITITKRWIFDGNLKYAIALNKNLNRCVGHEKLGI